MGENIRMVEILSGDLPHQVRSAKRVATLVYALQAVSFFLGGITLLIGVAVSHVRQPDARNTWLASHFRWQIRTFWFGLLWALLGLAAGFAAPGMKVWPVFPALLAWLAWRIAKGWLRLADGREMYVNP